MLPALRRSFPLGNELNVSALRSRMFSSAKLLILASAAVMSGLAPSTSLAQSTVAARPPVSPETMALHRLVKRPVAKLTASVDVAECSSGVNSAQGFGALARDQGHPGCDLFPAPANIGTNVGLSSFGPPPSTINQSLVGPVQLLNTGQVDATPGTITIPLYKGTVRSTGKTAWYILTDVSDQGIAQELGLNFSAKMKNINTAARTGNLGPDGNIIFDKGTVNFAAVRNLVAGPEGAEFPPTSFTPGEVGDSNYSPFVSITNAQGVIYNAPIVAYGVDASQINFPNGNVD